MIGIYELAKWLHILSSTLLFGLGLGTAFYMLMAWRSGRAVLAAGIGRMVVQADWIFTTSSGIIQPLSGFALVWLGGWDPLAGWLVVSYVLYVVALSCWLPVVALQIRATRTATLAEARGETLPPQYHAMMRIWFCLGWPAFLALVSIFLLMVAKPDIGRLFA
ncbi:MAG: DUF2269 domain-containing protein [Rhodospirillaceae bacterium]|nr:DUF2269 domain-containing protein [Rhodospirillaceae bacterium]